MIAKLKKIRFEIGRVGFTLGASCITIMTLSGQTKKWAIIFTVVALTLHLSNTVFDSDSNDKPKPIK
jgi:hypothetical protein